MSFISMSQYLIRLQIWFLVLAIMPLLLFIALYLIFPDYPAQPAEEYLMIILGAAFIDWPLAAILFNKKIKSARNEQGLGAKLDKYFQIAIIRYTLFSSAGLILAVGFFLTSSDIFTGVFLVSLIFAFSYWPTGPRVSNELRLRGDEREMVYFRKDKF